MPLEVLGRTRATLIRATSIPNSKEDWEIFAIRIVLGIDLCNFGS
jgi:hypothetical protein